MTKHLKHPMLVPDYLDPEPTEAKAIYPVHVEP